MKRWSIIPILLSLIACSLFVPTPPATETLSPLPLPPSATFMAVCTAPACSANETYFCSGNCPGGCGTACATVTPDAGLSPIATVDGAGGWIVRTGENLAFLDSSGVKPGFALQRVYAPLIDFTLVNAGNVYALTDPGNGSLTLNRVYPQERWFPNLDVNRHVEGSLRVAPIFSSDGTGLAWSRAEADGSPTRVVIVTSLETSESREVWRTDLPPEATGHAIVPLFYDEGRQTLVYALHTFYSGMTPTQLASIYSVNIAANEITPLWTLKPDGMYAGVSASVTADGATLAYLTWGEPQADFTLPWTLHLRDLSNDNETTYLLSETWEIAEVHFFSPDGNSLMLTASRRTDDGDYQSELLIFDIEQQRESSIYSANSETNPFLRPRAWSSGDWLILTNEVDNSTWVMRPDGGSLTQITPFEWVGLLEQ